MALISLVVQECGIRSYLYSVYFNLGIHHIILLGCRQDLRRKVDTLGSYIDILIILYVPYSSFEKLQQLHNFSLVPIG